MVLSTTRPPEQVLRWAADQMGTGAGVVSVQGLKDGAHPWLLRIRHAGQITHAVLRVGDPDHPEWLATEAAALALAEDHNLAAPRLLGVDPAGTAGMPAELVTVLPGTSRIPAEPSTERLRAIGASAAAIHAVPLAPGPDLPLRLRPIPGVDFSAERRATGSPSLLEAAEARLREFPVPAGSMVFVHGDLWQGNSMWSGGEFVGLVDWDQAGAGHPGVDLGWLRFDAAILYGADAPAEILHGWRDASGRDPGAVAYWDAVAALCSPADIAMWLAGFHREGRTDLSAATLDHRREAFLRQALEKLDVG